MRIIPLYLEIVEFIFCLVEYYCCPSVCAPVWHQRMYQMSHDWALVCPLSSVVFAKDLILVQVKVIAYAESERRRIAVRKILVGSG